MYISAVNIFIVVTRDGVIGKSNCILNSMQCIFNYKFLSWLEGMCNWTIFFIITGNRHLIISKQNDNVTLIQNNLLTKESVGWSIMKKKYNFSPIFIFFYITPSIIYSTGGGRGWGGDR